MLARVGLLLLDSSGLRWKEDAMEKLLGPLPDPAVVTGPSQAEVPAPPTPSKPRGGRPKWETNVKERVKAGIRRFSKPVADLADRDANEGDTRLLVTDFLCEVLGFDKYSDLTTEYQVKGEFADYGIRIDKELVAFIETKRVNTKLGPKHLRQIQMYAVNEGVEWLILTNGNDWQVYHLTFSQPVVVEPVLEVSLLGEDTGAQKANKLFYLTRESLKRRQINELWKAKQATSPRSLAEILLTETVITALRRELWRKRGHRVEADEVVKLLRETVLRPECLQ